MFKTAETKPYGKHYDRDVEKLAKHNQATYRFCPYASRNYAAMTKDQLKEDATEYEIGIYNSLRENFDLAVYVLEQSIGIKVSEKFAVKLLKGYLSGCGHMYKWATSYNIPWMLLFVSCAQNCFGKLVKKDSPIYSLLTQLKDVQLQQCYDSDWYIVKNNNNFIELSDSA